jgi:hypothetical protein
MKQKIFPNDVLDLDVEKCALITLQQDRFMRHLFNAVVATLIVLLLFYGRPVFFRIRSVAITILVVWLVNRYYTAVPLQNPLDLFTVHLMAWQFFQLICHWESHELWWPALVLQQASVCLFTALVAFIQYDIVYRHLPSQFHFIFLWCRSINDM